MTDKELLKLAAKAAGYQYAKFGGYLVVNGVLGNWDPLTDDGDALRLAVKLGIKDYFDIEVQDKCVQVMTLDPYEHCVYEEYKRQDPYAATRRAIVRAAAEIGKGKK